MSSDISAKLRHLVNARANFRCEYCLMPQSFALYKHEPDHIISRQHGGETIVANLACACFHCNRMKGPNVGSIDPITGLLVPFFNPRTQIWEEPFAWQGAMIQPLTAEARVTIKILRLNDEERLAEREILIEAGVYK